MYTLTHLTQFERDTTADSMEDIMATIEVAAEDLVRIWEPFFSPIGKNGNLDKETIDLIGIALHGIWIDLFNSVHDYKAVIGEDDFNVSIQIKSAQTAALAIEVNKLTEQANKKADNMKDAETAAAFKKKLEQIGTMDDANAAPILRDMLK